MSAHKVIRLRKATDINREHATFELLIDDVPVLDVGFSDDDKFEVSFNAAIVGMVLDYELLEKWIVEGRRMALLDKA